MQTRSTSNHGIYRVVSVTALVAMMLLAVFAAKPFTASAAPQQQEIIVGTCAYGQLILWGHVSISSTPTGTTFTATGSNSDGWVLVQSSAYSSTSNVSYNINYFFLLNWRTGATIRLFSGTVTVLGNNVVDIEQNSGDC